jgi:spore coat polysaccharide biosynthesis protein SpsF
MNGSKLAGAAETEQARFWQGDFGDEYIERNDVTPERVRQYTWMWAHILRAIEHDLPKSILEVGTGVGINLLALQRLVDATFHGVEPNAKARAKLAQNGSLRCENLLEGFGDHIDLPGGAVDLVFTSGVLIHIRPELVIPTLKEMHRVTSHYLVVVEYFADKPEEVVYRSHHGKLFKCDFGGVVLDNLPDMEIVDYGFLWKRATSMDNPTWWLFKKR